MVYRSKSIRTLGILQMVVGVLMGIFAIASIAAVYHWSSYIACGLWIGAWVFLTGLFGYLGARSDNNPNTCLIGLMLGFAVTTCVLTSIMVIIYSIAVADLGEILRCSHYKYYIRYHCYSPYSRYHVNYSVEAGIALAVIMLLMAITEFFIALASSIYGCNACCCRTPNNMQPTQQIAYIGPQQGNVVIVPAGGYYAGATVQTVTTYPAQQNTVFQMQNQQQPVYAPQAYPVAQGQAYNPPHQHPVPANPQVFQAQNIPEAEKPPPYGHPVPQ